MLTGGSFRIQPICRKEDRAKIAGAHVIEVLRSMKIEAKQTAQDTTAASCVRSGLKTSPRAHCRRWTAAFNPQNTPCIPAVKISVYIDLGQK